MTAEVAILNKFAVALAADSKVSLGDSGKTYDTVNKLFTLSKFHPVGAMIYGNPEFMEFPWETLIKDYRQKLGKRNFAQLSSFQSNFFSYLRKVVPATTADEQENVKSILSSVLHDIRLEIEEEFFRIDSNVNDRWVRASTNVLTAHIEVLDGVERYPFKRPMTPSRAASKYATQIKSAYEENFVGVEEQLNEDVRKLVIRVCGLMLSKDAFSSRMSGVVFAGFGEKEWFPSLIEIHTDGMINGEIKASKIRFADVGRRDSGRVMAFAQGDMVSRFMEGIDPDYQFFLEDYAGRFFIQGVLDVFDQFAKMTKKKKLQARKKVEAAAEENFDRLVQSSKKFRQMQYVNPIVSIVSILPLDELANLAESLVNLTSVKRRVSHDAESVGGAIDVAVISKGDGFVWIKRKHYFEPELNQSFMRRYLDVL